jgi:hypothetical protein
MIEAKDIDSGSLHGDEPCYSIRGHVDKGEMLAAVQAYELNEYGLTAEECQFTLADVHHVWATGPGPKPRDGEDVQWYEWSQEQKPGSFALTVVYA